jgi:hypothetical protein
MKRRRFSSDPFNPADFRHEHGMARWLTERSNDRSLGGVRPAAGNEPVRPHRVFNGRSHSPLIGRDAARS